MYKDFFGLNATPFSISPDPSYLLTTPAVEEALACLTFGINTRRGFILLTGAVGTGKTTLIYKLLDWLRSQRVPTAFLFNSLIDPPQLLEAIFTDLGLPYEALSKVQRLSRLNNFLLEQYRQGRTSVVIIDEAQNLSPEVLEEIRLLTNLETATEKLLQIVIVGQPELEQKLKRPELRQLNQRITLRARTLPLDLDETRAYIAQRLRLAGANGRNIFSPPAIESVYRFSAGIPRVINVLCDHSMIHAFADQQPTIERKVVEVVAHDFDLEDRRPTKHRVDDFGRLQVRGTRNVVRGTRNVQEAVEEETFEEEAFEEEAIEEATFEEETVEDAREQEEMAEAETVEDERVHVEEIAHVDEIVHADEMVHMEEIVDVEDTARAEDTDGEDTVAVQRVVHVKERVPRKETANAEDTMNVDETLKALADLIRSINL
jgi:general secretion pathway protein A